jgi:DNA repair exonuclease SbcCD ATPase subunit
VLGRWLLGRLRRWLRLDADRARALELESRIGQLASGHEQFARDAAAHLATLQSEWERFGHLLATLSASQQALLAQHENLSAALTTRHEALRAAFTVEHEALRAALTALEGAMADVEQAQTSVAVKLAGTLRVPE